MTGDLEDGRVPEPPARRFRGSVVRSYLERGWPFDTLVVSSESVVLTHFGTRVEVPRVTVRHVVVTTYRLPFLVQTLFSFEPHPPADGASMFVPYRASRLAETLEGLGWPVVRGRLGPP